MANHTIKTSRLESNFRLESDWFAASEFTRRRGTDYDYDCEGEDENLLP